MDRMVSFLYGWIEWFKRRFQHISQPIVFCFHHYMLLSFQICKSIIRTSKQFLVLLIPSSLIEMIEYITHMINAYLCVTCGIELIKIRQHKIATILHLFLFIPHFPIYFPSIAKVKVKSQTCCSILAFCLHFLCLRCNKSI